MFYPQIQNLRPNASSTRHQQESTAHDIPPQAPAWKYPPPIAPTNALLLAYPPPVASREKPTYRPEVPRGDKEHLTCPRVSRYCFVGFLTLDLDPPTILHFELELVHEIRPPSLCDHRADHPE